MTRHDLQRRVFPDSRARRWGSKRVAKNAQFVVVCLDSRLRGNDGVGDDDASRFTASRFPGQSCGVVQRTISRSGTAAQNKDDNRQ